MDHNSEDSLIAPPVDISNSSLLHQYVRCYLIQQNKPQNTQTRTVLIGGGKVCAVLVGGAAGVPWINIGDQAGKYIDSEFVSFMAAYGGLVTYGFTCIWAFLKMLDRLNRSSSQEKKILSVLAQEKIITTTASQIIGVISSVPTVYTASLYNENILVIAIAFFTTYALNSFGIYNLLNLYAAPFLKKHILKNANPISAQMVLRLDVIDHELEHSQLFEKLQSFEVRSTVDGYSDSKLFLSNMMLLHHSDEKYSGVKKVIKYSAMILFPCSNFIFNSVLTYHALQSFLKSNVSAVLLNPIVTLPLLGLDLYSTSCITSLMLSNKLCGAIAKPKISLLFSFVALFLSIFSAVPGGFIAYSQMNETFFGKSAVVFGLIFWTLRVALETNAITTIIKDVKNTVNGSLCHNTHDLNQSVYRSNLTVFKTMLKALPPEDQDAYIDDCSSSPGVSTL